MEFELEQFYKDIEIIRLNNFEMYVKLLAKFYVEVLPIIKQNENL